MKRKILMFDSTQLENEMSRTAFYRIDKTFVDFLKKCEEKYKIVGFTYDFEEPFNMGFLLGENREEGEGMKA